MGTYILLCPFRHGALALLTASCLLVPCKGPGLSALNTKAEDQRSAQSQVRSWERSEHRKMIALRPSVCLSIHSH